MKTVFAICLWIFGMALSANAEKKPNFIIIFTDDQGYNDLSCFGSKKIKTPNIDRLAKEGRKFTNFLVPSPVCTPSRAGLLTGCYPKRVGMHQGVLFPGSKKGLNPEEITIADHLKAQGYATACIGKWHLGDRKEVLPRQNGFDSYLGIPYSNDMNHPDNSGKVAIDSDESWQNQDEWVKKWNTPLIENEKIIELPCNQRTITRRYTDHAIDFVTTNKEQPFFLYLAHSMPHLPLFVPEDVYDPDPKNCYANTIEHIDAEVGRLMDTIRELNLSENTYVIFTSDNGPWLRFRHHAGSAKPLRGGKGTTFEGGQRVPCVMWAPGHIPPGTETSEIASTVDLLPTFAALANSTPDSGKKIDGVDISELMFNDVDSPRKDFVYYSARGQAEGIRKGKWKLLVQQRNKKKNSGEDSQSKALLFDLQADISESKDLAAKHPEVVGELIKQMREIDAEITKNARKAWHAGK